MVQIGEQDEPLAPVERHGLEHIHRANSTEAMEEKEKGSGL